MKKALTILLCMMMLLSASACGKQGSVRNTVEGNMKTYYKMNDGTWMCDDYIYHYRLEISGRMPNAAADTTFVYLSNIYCIMIVVFSKLKNSICLTYLFTYIYY